MLNRWVVSTFFWNTESMGLTLQVNKTEIRSTSKRGTFCCSKSRRTMKTTFGLRFPLCWLLPVWSSMFLVVDQVVHGVPQLHRQEQEQQQQQQQEEPPKYKYRANYTVDFQQLLFPSCTSEAPILGITCHGAPMEIVKVSHPLIACAPLSNSTVPGGTTFACMTNACLSNNTCDQVYQSNLGVAQAFVGPYGSIQFTCDGNTTSAVQADVVLTGRTNEGTCPATTTNNLTRPHARAVRLGISCPISSSTSTTSRAYVYDDTYAECRTNNTITFDISRSANDVYTCFNEQICENNNPNACDFTFDPIQVLTHIPSLVMDDCVSTTTLNVPVEDPTTSPVVTAPSPQQYQVRFQAAWTTFNDDRASCTSNYENDNPVIQIACPTPNNRSTIVFVSSTDPTMACVNVAADTLSCIGESEQRINQFVTVVYDCYGSSIPSSIVTYPETSAICENNVNDTFLTNWVSLGIMCDNQIIYNDLYLECADSHHNFVIDSNAKYFDGTRLLCTEGILLESNSLATNVRVIPDVSITTDDYWQSDASDTCYQLLLDGMTAPPVTVPVPTLAPIPVTQPPPVPTVAPGIVNPVTLTPVVQDRMTTPAPAVLPPTNLLSPVAAPVPTNDTTFVDPSTNDSTNGDSSDNKGLIIGAVGGVVGGIIISVLLFLVYQKGMNDGVVEHKVGAGSSDHQNDTENNTESQNSPSIPQSSNPADAGSSSVVTVTAMASPMREETVSDFYEVHYKDQSRSVIGTASGRTRPRSYNHNDKKKAPPVLARYYPADHANRAKPTSVVEIPTAQAIMCTDDVSKLGQSDSSIRRLGDSNSSLRMAVDLNRSLHISSSEWNHTVPIESNTEQIDSEQGMDPPVNSFLAESNSSLRMVGGLNHSFQILGDSNSTIPTQSNLESTDNNINSNQKIPLLEDSNSSLRMSGDSNHRSFQILGDSNGTIPTQSNLESTGNIDIDQKKPPSADFNSSLRMSGDSNNRSIQILGDSNSTIPTESNADSYNDNRKITAVTSSAVEL